MDSEYNSESSEEQREINDDEKSLSDGINIFISKLLSVK